MDTSWLSTIAKTLARFARAYPLRQIALAAVLFVPTTVALHLLFSLFDAEKTLTEMIGAWALNVMGAGLAFLIALTWITIRDRSTAKRRRSDRTRRRSEIAGAHALARETWRNTIRALNDDDKRMLRNFVDQRRIRFESRTLDGPGSQVLQRLESLGILDQYWPYAVLAVSVFDLLLSEPALVDSASNPTARITAA